VDEVEDDGFPELRVGEGGREDASWKGEESAPRSFALGSVGDGGMEDPGVEGEESVSVARGVKSRSDGEIDSGFECRSVQVSSTNPILWRVCKSCVNC
jgi:hypothetical protein